MREQIQSPTRRLATLTDEELRVRVAELCGISVCPGCKNEIDPTTCHCGDDVKAHGYGSGHNAVPMGCMCCYLDDKYRETPWQGVPNYPADLNAMHEAEKGLSKKQLQNYGTWLTQLLGLSPPNRKGTFLYHATARQRALAFVLTLDQSPDSTNTTRSGVLSKEAPNE